MYLTVTKTLCERKFGQNVSFTTTNMIACDPKSNDCINLFFETFETITVKNKSFKYAIKFFSY